MRGPTARALQASAAARADGPRLIVFHGTADGTVHPSNAGLIIAAKGDGPGPTSTIRVAASPQRRGYARLMAGRADGRTRSECWLIEGAKHAWSGGSPSGSYTDPRGPDASAAMVRFFLTGTADPIR